jgi:uncharacterized membrane protein YphA (DoxX/SURF4 family)
MKYNLLSSAPFHRDTGIAIVRIVVGLFMIYHGWEVFDQQKMLGYAGWENFKKLPAPLLVVYFGKASELVAGLLLFAGFLTRLGCVILAASMLFIIFFIGHGQVWYDDQHPFLFVLLAMVFFFTGPGKWSVDGQLFSKAKK